MRKLLATLLTEVVQSRLKAIANSEAGRSSEMRKTKEEIRETSMTLNELLRAGIKDVGNERNKFEKVEMPVSNGIDPDGWLFRAECYNLSEAEKLTVAIISFEAVALDWYRAKEEQTPFPNWKTLKMRLLQRFRSSR